MDQEKIDKLVTAIQSAINSSIVTKSDIEDLINALISNQNDVVKTIWNKYDNDLKVNLVSNVLKKHKAQPKTKINEPKVKNEIDELDKKVTKLLNDILFNLKPPEPPESLQYFMEQINEILNYSDRPIDNILFFRLKEVIFYINDFQETYKDKFPWGQLKIYIQQYIKYFTSNEKMHMLQLTYISKSNLMQYIGLIKNFLENITSGENESNPNYENVLKHLDQNYYIIRTIYILERMSKYLFTKDAGPLTGLRILQVVGEGLKNTVGSANFSSDLRERITNENAVNEAVADWLTKLNKSVEQVNNIQVGRELRTTSLDRTSILRDKICYLINALEIEEVKDLVHSIIEKHLSILEYWGIIGKKKPIGTELRTNFLDRTSKLRDAICHLISVPELEEIKDLVSSILKSLRSILFNWGVNGYRDGIVDSICDHLGKLNDNDLDMLELPFWFSKQLVKIDFSTLKKQIISYLEDFVQTICEMEPEPSEIELNTQLWDLEKICEKYGKNGKMPKKTQQGKTSYEICIDMLNESLKTNNMKEIEMLLLIALNYISEVQNNLTPNYNWYKDEYKFLTGRSLRNHLAHGDAIVELLNINEEEAVRKTAELLIEPNVNANYREEAKILTIDERRNRTNMIIEKMQKWNKLFKIIVQGKLVEVMEITDELDQDWINSKNYTEYNVLQLAAQNVTDDNLKVFEFIFERNPKLLFENYEIGFSIDEIASVIGNYNIIKRIFEIKICSFLLENGCVQNTSSDTAFELKKFDINNIGQLMALVSTKLIPSEIPKINWWDLCYYGICCDNTLPIEIITNVLYYELLDTYQDRCGNSYCDIATKHNASNVMEYLSRIGINLNGVNSDQKASPFLSHPLGDTDIQQMELITDTTNKAEKCIQTLLGEQYETEQTKVCDIINTTNINAMKVYMDESKLLVVCCFEKNTKCFHLAIMEMDTDMTKNMNDRFPYILNPYNDYDNEGEEEDSPLHSCIYGDGYLVIEKVVDLIISNVSTRPENFKAAFKTLREWPKLDCILKKAVQALENNTENVVHFWAISLITTYISEKFIYENDEIVVKLIDLVMHGLINYLKEKPIIYECIKLFITIFTCDEEQKYQSMMINDIGVKLKSVNFNVADNKMKYILDEFKQQLNVQPIQTEKQSKSNVDPVDMLVELLTRHKDNTSSNSRIDGFDNETKNTQEGPSPLSEIITNGDITKLDTFLQNQSEILSTSRFTDGKSSLHLAMNSNTPEMIQTIYEKVPHLMMERDVNNQTPIDIAFQQGNDEVIETTFRLIIGDYDSSHSMPLQAVFYEAVYYKWAATRCALTQSLDAIRDHSEDNIVLYLTMRFINQLYFKKSSRENEDDALKLIGIAINLIVAKFEENPIVVECLGILVQSFNKYKTCKIMIKEAFTSISEVVHNKPDVSYIFDTLLRLFQIFKFHIDPSGYKLLHSHAFDVMHYCLDNTPGVSHDLKSPIYAIKLLHRCHKYGPNISDLVLETIAVILSEKKDMLNLCAEVFVSLYITKEHFEEFRKEQNTTKQGKIIEKIIKSLLINMQIQELKEFQEHISDVIHLLLKSGNGRGDIKEHFWDKTPKNDLSMLLYRCFVYGPKTSNTVQQIIEQILSGEYDMDTIRLCAKVFIKLYITSDHYTKITSTENSSKQQQVIDQILKGFLSEWDIGGMVKKEFKDQIKQRLICRKYGQSDSEQDDYDY